MRFDIEGFITFDTEEASLVNLLTGDCIELSATSTRLLTNLLQYRGDIISRVDIFQSVFEKYGARPSNSNLNQYISTLRRSLADLGIEKNVIITVPRIGFKISEEVIITSDNDYSSSFTLPMLTAELPQRSLLLQHRKAVISFILALTGLLLLSSFLCLKNSPLRWFSSRINVLFMALAPSARTKYSAIKNCSPLGLIVRRLRKSTFSTDN
ncbi:winged helix-turn-helix domain-containing protein [Klebsiella pasteurii]|nr:winged helix-turn-helix domain-containing protein [Klebsiella pasteurii]